MYILFLCKIPDYVPNETDVSSKTISYQKRKENLFKG